MACLLIWVFTVDIQFTFYCATCEVSTLVGMIMHDICNIPVFTFEKAAFNYETFLLKGCKVMLVKSRMLLIIYTSHF